MNAILAEWKAQQQTKQVAPAKVESQGPTYRDVLREWRAKQ